MDRALHSMFSNVGYVQRVKLCASPVLHQKNRFGLYMADKRRSYNRVPPALKHRGQLVRLRTDYVVKRQT